MNKQETARILQTISDAYVAKFKITDNAVSILNTWHEILKDEPYEEIAANLQNFIATATHAFPPTVSELLTKKEKSDRAIPDYEETKSLFRTWEQPRNVASEETKQAALEEMRRILRINKGGGDQ